MNRARWYSSSTVLVNGEIYIQGGNGGGDRPEVRQQNGNFRLLIDAGTTGFARPSRATSSRPTAASSATTRTGKCTTSMRRGTGSLTARASSRRRTPAGPRARRCSGPARSCRWAATRTAPRSSTSTARSPSSRRRNRCRRSASGSAPPCSPTAGCSRPAAAEVDNQLTDVNNSAEIWNPATGTGPRHGRRHARACITPRRCCCRMRPCWSPAAVPRAADQHERRDLLSAVSVR